MSREIVPSTGDIEQAVAAEAASGGVSSDAEYTSRLWLRLAGIDPDAVPVPAGNVTDARALEKAREVIDRAPVRQRHYVWSVRDRDSAGSVA